MAGVQSNLNALIRGVSDEVEKSVSKRLEDFTQTLDEKMKEVDQKIISGVQLKLEYKDKKITLKGLKHHKFPQLLTIASQRIPVMLVGPAGTGKTYAAEQLAKALGLPFYAISVGSQTSKTDLVGYMNANGNYVTTAYRTAYDATGKGGVLVMDEIDAGNSNVTIQLNSGLASDMMAFPDKMVKRHPDFIFIGTANTYGHGANREYVGRNQLDAATLDRFATIEWELDKKLEKKLVSPYKSGKSWLKVVEGIRKYVKDNGLRMLVTPRASIHGARLLDEDMDIDSVIEATLLGSAPEKAFADVRRIATLKWQEELDNGVSKK